MTTEQVLEKFIALPLMLRIALAYFVTFVLGFVLMFAFHNILTFILVSGFIGSIFLIGAGIVYGQFSGFLHP